MKKSLGGAAIITIIQNIYGHGLLIKTDIVSDLITFFSIIFGFYITSLAIFATSRYVAGLYKITDVNDKRRTLQQTLLSNYKKGLFFLFVSIVYLLCIQLIMNQPKSVLSFTNPWLFPFSGLITLNIIYGWLMLSDLINVVVQEGKSSV